jgi:hypothetical protein
LFAKILLVAAVIGAAALSSPAAAAGTRARHEALSAASALQQIGRTPRSTTRR